MAREVYRRFFSGERRWVPRTETKPPDQQTVVLNSRRPAWRWEFYAPLARYAKGEWNPRRFVPRTESAPRWPFVFRAHPKWQWQFFAPVWFPNPRRFVPIVSTGEVAAEHWWLDYEQRGWWPLQYALPAHDPTITLNMPSEGSDDLSEVLIGCKDGYIRQLDRTAFRDDGQTFESYCMIGPIRVGLADGNVGLVEWLEACMTDDSGNATWELRVADDYETAATLTSVVVASGTWFGGGLNATNRPRRRGAAFSVTVSNAETNDGWSVEEVNSMCSERGMRR